MSSERCTEFDLLDEEKGAFDAPDLWIRARVAYGRLAVPRVLAVSDGGWGERPRPVVRDETGQRGAAAYRLP